MAKRDEDNTGSEIVLYQAEDRAPRIEVRLESGTVWLSQAQMAELYQTTVPNINLHLKAIFAESELAPATTIKSGLIVRSEGGRTVRRQVKHYNLEAILAVGYRVRGSRGTQFRQWATTQLREYLVKGFVMDDERLKYPPGPGQDDYFERLLERIRDIRSSARVFWRKVLDIYATSVDYDPSAEASQQFFATVQNKMHWATHGGRGGKRARRCEQALHGPHPRAARRRDPQDGRGHRQELPEYGRAGDPEPDCHRLLGIRGAASAQSAAHAHVRMDRQAGRIPASV
jgi:hypothetical protein